MNKFKTIKNILDESSLSRIYKHYLEHDTATISAFRYATDCGNGEIYTKSENMKRNSEMKKFLLSKGYGCTPIKGVYIENYGSDNERHVKEESFFVVNLTDSNSFKRDLQKISQKYEQDSFAYNDNSKNMYKLIGTSNCPDAYPSKGEEIKLGKPMMSASGEFHSSVRGRPFIFKE